MKFEVKYVEFELNTDCIKRAEEFTKSFEVNLNKYASNTKIVKVNEKQNDSKHIIKLTLQKHIALNTLNNIINNIQNTSRVVCDSINYEYNVSRTKINVKMF